MRLTIRFDDEDVELLRKETVARREDVSSFVRQAVRRQFAELGLLSQQDSKALGIKNQK